jgi:BirA family biotin operon repressor/biotin-[acetyl-CoA-carboxylase] ligase
LAPEAEAAGFRLIALATTPSTNDEALTRAEAGDPGRLWIIAGEQTRGRGRHGRTWSSPPGNLYASLLLADPCEPPVAPQLGFVAGLAIHDAAAMVTGLATPRLSLKWPNDLLLDGAKVSGILLEGHQLAGTGRFTVIVGIGVNVATAPTGAPYPTTSLDAFAGPVDISTLASALTGAMSRRLAQWDCGAGFGIIRDAWLSRASGVGGSVTVRLPGREAHGVFTTLDAHGRLLLDGPHGREVIDAGDLFFGGTRSVAGSAA